MADFVIEIENGGEEVSMETGAGGVAEEGRVVERKWQHFPGNARFPCNGRLVTGPPTWVLNVEVTLILLTSALFHTYVSPEIINEVTIYVPIAGIFLAVLALGNLAAAAMKDPGIVPRATRQESEALEREAGPEGIPPSRDVMVNGVNVTQKYCRTCHIYRPPRAAHCRRCNSCISRMDHHCPFLNNCVGARNYHNFVAFVTNLFILTMFYLALTIFHVVRVSQKIGTWTALKTCHADTFIIVMSLGAGLFTGALLKVHFTLISRNETTNEMIKKTYRGRKNPYSRETACQNWNQFCCGPVPPSQLDPRGFVTPEFLASLMEDLPPVPLPPPRPSRPRPRRPRPEVASVTLDIVDQAQIYESPHLALIPPVHGLGGGEGHVDPINPHIIIVVEEDAAPQLS